MNDIFCSRTMWLGAAVLVSSVVCAAFGGEPAPGVQITIPQVEKMPRLPAPYGWKDWKKTAHDFDAAAFDFERKGENMPLPWWDKRRINFDRDTFAMPAYIGSFVQTPASNAYDTITCLGAVLGGTLAGIDKSAGGTDWVLLCENYFGRANGENLYLNNVGGVTGFTFWYDILPSLLSYQILDHYPGTGDMDAQMRITADRWIEASRLMGGSFDPWVVPDYDHTGFSFSEMKPQDNGLWKEPDVAAAIAWLEYLAYVKTGEKKYLDAAEWGFQFLDERKVNPYYENLLPYGVYAAARSNAERGTTHDLHKLINWIFTDDNPRGWGISIGRWGERDCAGMTGSMVPNEGYGFAMNTFLSAGLVAPVARYDDRYARTIGKWLLNLANSSRYFYPDGLPPEHQTAFAWAKANDPEFCLGYEGLRERGRRRDRPVPGTPSPDNPPHGGPQVLEADAGGRVLEHVWKITISPGTEHSLVAWAKPHGPPATYRFSIASTPEGPFKPVFEFAPQTAHTHLWKRLDPASSTIYVKVESDAPVGAGLSVTDLFVETILHPAPYAMGDPQYLQWGAVDLGLYGSAYVGFMAALFEQTDVEGILQINCIATETFRGKAHPTFLYYNPHKEERSVRLDVGTEPRDIYDAVENRFLARGVRGKTPFLIAADTARLIVVCPTGGKLSEKSGQLSLNDTIIDYRRNN